MYICKQDADKYKIREINGTETGDVRFCNKLEQRIDKQIERANRTDKAMKACKSASPNVQCEKYRGKFITRSLYLQKRKNMIRHISNLSERIYIMQSYHLVRCPQKNK